MSVSTWLAVVDGEWPMRRASSALVVASPRATRRRSVASLCSGSTGCSTVIEIDHSRLLQVLLSSTPANSRGRLPRGVPSSNLPL